jgi:hypothetical protein
MKLIDFDDTSRFKREGEGEDRNSMPLPGNHPVMYEDYSLIGSDDRYHLIRGTKQYRIERTSGAGPWTKLDE